MYRFIAQIRCPRILFFLAFAMYSFATWSCFLFSCCGYLDCSRLIVHFLCYPCACPFYFFMYSQSITFVCLLFSLFTLRQYRGSSHDVWASIALGFASPSYIVVCKVFQYFSACSASKFAWPDCICWAPELNLFPSTPIAFPPPCAGIARRQSVHTRLLCPSAFNLHTTSWRSITRSLGSIHMPLLLHPRTNVPCDP